MEWGIVCALVLMLVNQSVQGLIIESPCSQQITHVTGEFTNSEILESNSISRLELVSVVPFNGCTSIHQDLTNRIALIQRGDCNFVLKVWNAQNAGAKAVVIMDSAKRDAPPYHIIMQKDENVTHVYIPSVFISYEDGETLLYKIQHATPWKPVLVSINSTGELKFTKSQFGWLKRVVSYFILVSLVCGLSSVLSIVSCMIFAWIGTKWRTRMTKRLRIIPYRPHLLTELLQEAVHSARVLEYIALDEEEEEEDKQVNVSVHPMNSTGSRPVDESIKRNDVSMGPVESCSICLEDFIFHEPVKVLPCHHFFHAHCIEPWLEQRCGWCPLCKKNAIAPMEQKFFFNIPIEQMIQQEHWLHSFLLMLPASLVSCLFINVATSMARSMWP